MFMLAAAHVWMDMEEDEKWGVRQSQYVIGPPSPRGKAFFCAI